MAKPDQKLRYLPESYVPGHKGSQHTCIACGRPKQFTRYIDTRTGELLPEDYGICNKVNSCGYSLSPYYKGPSGMSYAESVFEQFKSDNPLPSTRPPRQQPVRRATMATAIPPAIHEIPRVLVDRSLSHYDQNQLATLLRDHFGTAVAEGLLRRFQIGTSSHWPGACIFWYIDEQSRVHGGQIKLFGRDGHTVKYMDRENVKRSKTNWVHTVLQRRLEKAGAPSPEWLQVYIDNKAQASPCLFGLPQLLTAPPGTPVAIVEAPKTAIIATGYLPDFVWLATGGKSYLTAERLSPLRDRSLLLWPDMDAYHDIKNDKGKVSRGWLSKAAELQGQGFDVEVSDFLERHASDWQRQQGLDLADFLLKAWPTLEEATVHERITADNTPRVVTTLAKWMPDTILRPDPAMIEYL